MGDEILKKLDIFIQESRVKGETIEGQRPVQFMQWWGDFRPGDRVDVMFDEEFISIVGTNAEGNFAGVKKEMNIEDPTEIDEFKGAEGRIWNFV
jgi:hypothetical protein